jgi:hypothetical protein
LGGSATRVEAGWDLIAAGAGMVHVGPALTSHNPKVAAQAGFRNYTESK